MVLDSFITKKLNTQIWIRKAYNNVEIGDSIVGYSSFNPILTPKIPKQFDYSKFLENQRIYAQSFTDTVLCISKKPSIFSMADRFRGKIIALYEELGIKGKNLSVLVALSLGEKQLLDAETKSAFSQAGAMHILAVSGPVSYTHLTLPTKRIV